MKYWLLSWIHYLSLALLIALHPFKPSLRRPAIIQMPIVTHLQEKVIVLIHVRLEWNPTFIRIHGVGRKIGSKCRGDERVMVRV